MCIFKCHLLGRVLAIINFDTEILYLYELCTHFLSMLSIKNDKIDNKMFFEKAL